MSAHDDQIFIFVRCISVPFYFTRRTQIEQIDGVRFFKFFGKAAVDFVDDVFQNTRAILDFINGKLDSMPELPKELHKLGPFFRVRNIVADNDHS